MLVLWLGGQAIRVLSPMQSRFSMKPVPRRGAPVARRDPCIRREPYLFPSKWVSRGLKALRGGAGAEPLPVPLCYILSGASMPISHRPVLMTSFMAFVSATRAADTAGSSVRIRCS